MGMRSPPSLRAASPTNASRLEKIENNANNHVTRHVRMRWP